MPEFAISLGDLYHGLEGTWRQYKLVDAMATVDMDTSHGSQGKMLIARASMADALAWALYKNGNYDEGPENSVRLQLKTKDALKLFTAGMIALRLGEQAQARGLMRASYADEGCYYIIIAGHGNQIVWRPL